MRRPARSIASTVLLALALTSLQTSSASAEPPATPAAPAAPPAATPAGFVPGESVEDLGRRTRLSKTFKNPDGSFTSHFATGTIHAKENGRWVDVETDLETRGDGRHHAKKLPFGLAFGDENTGEVATVTISGSEIGFTLVGARKADKPKVSKNTIRYANVFPDVDLHFRVHGDGYKQNFELARRGTPSDYAFTVRSPADVTFAKQDDGGITLTRDGKQIGEIPAPFMAESEDGEALGPRSRAVRYDLTGEPGSYRIGVHADRAWLDAPERKYPVIIDPTLYATGGGMSNDLTTCSAAGLENTYYSDLGVGYESATPLGWCKGWLRFDLTSLAGTSVTAASLDLTLWHSYDNRSSTVYVDRLDPVDFPNGWAVENNMTYRGGAYRPWRSYSSGLAGEDYRVGRYSFPVTGWGQVNRGTWAGLMIESGANGYYDGPLPSGTATIAQHLYKLFRGAEYGIAADRPTAVVTWTNNAPYVPSTTSLYPADGYVAQYLPSYLRAGFSDPDGYATGYGVFEVWNDALTIRRYSGNGGTVSSGGNSYWYPSGPWADGRYRWRAAANDGRGGQSGWTGWRYLTVDNTDPGTPTNARWSAGDATSSTTLTAQWTPGYDSLSGVSNHYLRVSTRADDPATTTDEFNSGLIWSGYTNSASGSYTLTSANGITAGRTYYFRVASRDAAANQSLYSATSAGITVDQVAPGQPATLVSTSHPANVPMRDQTVDVTWTAATDNETAVAGYEVLFDQSETATAGTRTVYGATARFATSAPLGDGSWWAHVRAYDKAGNRGQDVTYGPVVVDTVSPGTPGVSCPTHPSGTWTASRQLVCDFVASPGTTGFSVVRDQVNDTVPPESVNNIPPAYSEQLPVDGQHWLHVRAVDAAGNWSPTSAPYDIRVDSTAPAKPAISSLTHGTDTGWYPDNDPHFRWTATDTAPITGYSYVVDQNATTEAPYVETAQTETTLTDKADGVWYVHVRARNAAGLWSDTAHRAARIDTTLPAAAVATSRTHAPNEALNVPQVEMSWAASPGSDAPSGIAGYSYAFTADPSAPIDAVTETTGTSASGSPGNGTWYFHLRTVDRAGNSQETVYGPIVIDPNGPPVGAGERTRFLDLWLPRAQSEEFYEEYFASDGYPQYILDEGFHGLPDIAKRYLGGELWTAFAATGSADPSLDDAGRQVMYEFVFDKEKQAHPADPSGWEEDAQPVAPREDITKERPAALESLIRQSEGAYHDLTDTVEGLLPVGTRDLPVDVDALPAVVEQAVRSTLSTVALDEIAKLAAAGDPVGEVLARLAKVDAAHGVTIDSRAVFALPDRLPIGYTACWDTAGHDGCEDALLVGQPVDVDVTGDGSDDVTVTFGPVPGSTVTDLASLKLDVKRITPLPTIPGVPPVSPPSDLAGKPIKAHVWVVYDLGAAGTPTPGRVQFGFDGFVRGERLAEASSLSFTPSDLLAAAQRDFGGAFALTHTWPDDTRPKWALTIGRRALEGDPDPLDAALTFDAATNVSGHVSIRNDDGGVDLVNRRTSLRFDTPVGAPLTADIKETISSANETTVARVVLPSIPAGTYFETFRRRETSTSADETEVVVDNAANPAARLPRLAGVATITNDRGQDHMTFDLRDIPVDTSLHGIRAMDRSFAYIYDSSAESGPVAGSLRTKDTNGVLTMAMQVSASALPTYLNASYGPSSTADDTSFAVSSSTRVRDLSFTGYDRDLRLTMDAELADLPTYVFGEVSPGATYLNVVAGYAGEAGVGYASGVVSANGGRVARRTGEHATLIRQGNAIGASFQLRGLRAGKIRLAEKALAGEFTLDPGSFNTTNPFAVAMDVDGIQGSMLLSNLPQRAKVAVDLATPIAVTAEAGGTAIDKLTFYGRHPSGAIADGVVAQLPATMSLAATFDGNAANASFTGSSGGMDIVRSMFSSDLDPGDASGFTVRVAAVDLPARMTAYADRAERVARYTGLSANGAPAGIGRIDARVSYRGGRARVPAGQHATFTGTTSSWGASARIDNVQMAFVDANASLTAGHALVTMAQRGGPLTVDVALDDLRGYAYASEVPARLEVWADVAAKSGRFEASESVDRVTVYGTKVGAGPTISGTIEGAPAWATAKVTKVGTGWNVRFDSSAPIRRAAGFYSEQHVPQGIGATTDHVSVDASATRAADGTYTQMPKTVDATFDLGARSVSWRSPTPIGNVKLRGRGSILHGWVVSAEATDVPAEFDAAFGVNTKLFDGRGGSVGHLRIQASNHGPLIDGGPDNHLVGRFDLSDDHIDVSADISGVSFAKMVTGDKSVGIEGSATNGGRPLRADVTVDDLVAADGAHEFTVRITGRIDKIPGRVMVTARQGSLDYDSVGRLGGELQLWAGWARALTHAVEPGAVPQGISVTDAACLPNDGACNPEMPDGSPRFMCSETKDTCYAARAVIKHTDAPTHLSAELRNGLTVPLVIAGGLAAGALRVRADLRHVIDDHLVVDLTQHGIKDGAVATIGPITITQADEGTVVDAEAGIAPAAGQLSGTVSMPEAVFGFGGTPDQPTYKISYPRAYLRVSDLPSAVKLSARWGRRPRVEVNTSAAVPSVRAQFSAKLEQRSPNGGYEYVPNLANFFCWLQTRFCGSVELDNLPAAPTTPISVEGFTPRYLRTHQRVYASPNIEFDAPAAGVGLTVNVDPGLLALAKGEVDLYFDTATGTKAQARVGKLTAMATSLSHALDVTASLDRRTATIASPTDTGSLYVEADSFEVDASGRMKEGIPLPGGGPFAQARVALGGKVVLRGEYSHVSIESFRNATLEMDEYHLGFGLSGNYGRFELGIKGFEMDVSDPTVALGIRIMPILPWNKDFFSPSVQICSCTLKTLHNFTPIVMNADEYGPMSFTGQYGGIGIPGIDLELRPSPRVLPYDKQGLVRIDGDGKRKLFSVLPAATNTLAVNAWGMLIAAVYNPFDNTSMRVRLGL